MNHLNKYFCVIQQNDIYLNVNWSYYEITVGM